MLERLSDAVFRSTAESIWLLDETGRVLWANDRLSALLDEAPDQIARRNFLDFCADGVAAERFRACATDRSEQRCEMSFVQSGKVVSVDVRLIPFSDPDGSPNAIVALMTDVTSERQAEAIILRAAEELERRLLGADDKGGPRRKVVEPADYRERLLELTEQIVSANRELEAFSYSVSHDLREPLRSIDGFSRILIERYEKQLDDRGRDYLRRVRAAAQRMGLLIADMLSLARIARADMTSGTVDITAISRTIAADLAAAEPNRHVDVRVSEGLTAAGDPRLLSVVLTNLIGNAWKFTGRNPAARIAVSRCESATDDVFLVSDNGAGFEMKYVDKLFRPFQRLHSHEDFAGTGVGLATVKRILARHGGKAWAEAKVGDGAQVYFSVPRRRTEEGAA
jgi:PAS domain S-box-containing protein